MQLLYAIDVGRIGRAGEPPSDPAEPEPAIDREALLGAIDTEFDADPAVHHAAVDLAIAAWASRHDADPVLAELAPEWPVHRQPPVDRAILRLAWHEMASGRTPMKVAINEAVELAKAYAGEESPMFINGVLDKAARRLPGTADPPATPTPPPPDADAWLEDAKKHHDAAAPDQARQPAAPSASNAPPGD